MRYGGAEGSYGGYGAIFKNLTASNISLTGGTITGVNVPYVLARSNIPLIGLSSGSVSAAGAISGITALPIAYPSAYCYFPANALATSIAAGWYYCTFSTTTAGTAYLNTWDGASTPTIPASLTSVTDGKGAFTGDTTEQGALVTLPANAMGPNGYIEIWSQSAHTNSAGTKTMKHKAVGNGFLATSYTTSTTAQFTSKIRNMGTGTQIAQIYGTVGTTVTNQATLTRTGDSTVASTAGVTHTRNTATDNAIIEGFEIKVMYG